MMVVLVDVKKIENIDKPLEPLKEPQDNTCTCKSSNCLRLHCNCFQAGSRCGQKCKCVDCLNQQEQKSVEINSMAFKDKFKTNESVNKKFHTRGCKCHRNQCKKNYCECKKYGLVCSTLCKCENCENGKIDLNKEQIKKLHDNNSRNKDKFEIEKILNPQKFFNVPSEIKEAYIVRYQPHRNTIKKN